MLHIRELQKEDLLKFKSSKDFDLPADIYNDNNIKYFLVYDEDGNKNLAVFDIRKTPDSIKQMRIYYAVDLTKHSDMNGSGYFLEKSMTALNIITKIFRYVLPDDESICTKIYTANVNEYAIFSIMAKNLLEQGDYDVKLYSKWIEIDKKKGE